MPSCNKFIASTKAKPLCVTWGYHQPQAALGRFEKLSQVERMCADWPFILQTGLIATSISKWPILTKETHMGIWSWHQNIKALPTNQPSFHPSQHCSTWITIWWQSVVMLHALLTSFVYFAVYLGQYIKPKSNASNTMYCVINPVYNKHHPDVPLNFQKSRS